MSLEEKIVEEMKKKFPELISEEDLKKLAERALYEAFFAPQKKLDIKKSSYYQPVYVDAPSLFVERFAELAQPIVEAFVLANLKNESKRIEEAVKEYVNENNITLIATGLLYRQLSGDFQVAMSQIIHNIKNV